jgi:spermidine synthase
MAKNDSHKRGLAKRKVPGTPPFILFTLILACFFISGLTGLTYEILWTRMIVKIIGSSAFAVSIVLTVFMGGLGLGSYLAGRTIDRVKLALKLVGIYGLLELGIGCYGLVLPLLLAAFKPLYAVLYNHLFDYFLVYNLLTFVGCALLLIIPATCMGATLPILSRFFVTRLSHVGTYVGRLYGLNTIGAAVGSLMCGFWLVDLLGIWGTLALAVALNGVIGAACVFMSARSPKSANLSKEPAVKEEKPAEAHPPGTDDSFASYALVIFAVSGFCAMVYEVIWIKLLGLIVGPTTYSFTIVLVTFIACLAVGAMFFGWLGDRVNNTMALLVVTQVAAAIFALMFSQFVGNSQTFFAKLIFQFKDRFAYLQLVKAAALFLFMFPPTFFLGATFPLVGKVCTTSLLRTGRSIGFAYAVNSVGAVLGSFCAGFLLIPFVGKERGLSLAIALQLMTALFVGLRIFRKAKMPVLRWSPLALAACLGVAFSIHYPHWDRKALSRSRYHRFEQFQMKNAGWWSSLFSGPAPLLEEQAEELVYYGDGIGGFTTVEKYELLGKTKYALCNSGKTDASYPGDMITQALLAHFPLLFHPDTQDVLVIGLASGITAGEVLNYPVKRLDIVDINEKVVAASEFFRRWNNNVLSDSRTRLIIQDGRAHLAMTDRMYDVISSEPSNPWMAGLASLFTRECFELGKAHLNDGGIFVQWTHAYEMDWSTFAMIGRTFADVFPNSILLNSSPTTNGHDYLLIGIKGDKKLDADVAARNLKYAQRSKNMTLPDHRLFYNLIVSEDLKNLFGDGPIHTEARPYLEFAAPKLLYTEDPAIRQVISQKSWLSDDTKEIVREISKSLDTRIDFVAYALSLYAPSFVFENRVDLSKATPEQRQRFSDLLTDYCKNNLVDEIDMLKDKEMLERCLSAQEEGIKERMAHAKNPVPFVRGLGQIASKRGEFDVAVAYFLQVLKKSPDDAKTHNSLANVLVKQRKFEEAIGHLKRAVELAPGDAKINNNLGWALSECACGRTAEAIKYFSTAVKLDARFPIAQFNMGRALASQRKYYEATDYILEAVRLAPSYTEAHTLLGDVLLERGQPDQAILQYSATLDIEPRNPIATHNMGNALAAQDKIGEAIQYFSKAIELNPDYVEALNSLAWTLATDSDSRFRDGTRAVSLAERACRLSGNKHAWFLDTLAAAYAEAGEFERAKETAQRAITLARSAGRTEWVQEIETRLQLYNQRRAFKGRSSRAGS